MSLPGWLFPLWWSSWWVYLWHEDRDSGREVNRLARAWCRLRGHPAGVRWHSHGFEPDMRCKNCGDDLG